MTRDELIDEMIGNFVDLLKEKDVKEVIAHWDEDLLGYEMHTTRRNHIQSGTSKLRHRIAPT